MKSLTKIAVLLASTALTAAPAYAQVAAPPAGSSESTLGEVVVTANRVETTAQRTPISLTVYNGEALVESGVHSVQALATIDPSVSVTSSTGAAYVAIRGIASTDVTEIGDPSVPVARDGFFTNRSFSIGSSLYDVQRIEVLKGPQGTLFGRNSTGGLVNIITNKPVADFGGFANVEAGTYSLFSGEAAVNLPLSDRVQLRLAGFGRTHKGYRKLTTLNGRGDDDDSWSGRAQLAFQPLDGFSGLVGYQHDNVDDVGDVAMPSPLAQVPDLSHPKTFPNYQPTSTRMKTDRLRWEFSYDKLPGDLTLFYAGGYDRSRWNHALDATGPAGAPPLQQFVQSESPDTWNHEIRIATPQDRRFTLQAGYFHFSEKNTVNSGLLQNTGPYAGRYLIKFDYDIETKSDAVFGQAGYALSDTLKLTAGARYTRDQKTRVGDAVLDLEVASGGHAPPIKITTPGNGNIKQSNPTYHLGLDWNPSSTNLIYAKFDTGYKSGGFNSNGSAPSVDYGPEKLRAFEAGTKNRFLDNRLQVNASAFYQTYNGYQASQTTAVISSGNGVFNIGSAKIYGLEGQVNAIVDPLGRFDLNATLLHARFDGNIGQVARGDPAATPTSIGGNRLPNAPSMVVSAGFEHAFDLGSATLTARIDGKYSSAFYYTVFNDPDTRQKAYTTGNLSLIYAPHAASWQVQGYVRNFTDETVLANAARNYVSGVNTYQFAPPRTYGVRVSYTF